MPVGLCVVNPTIVHSFTRINFFFPPGKILKLTVSTEALFTDSWTEQISMQSSLAHTGWFV